MAPAAAPRGPRRGSAAGALPRSRSLSGWSAHDSDFGSPHSALSPVAHANFTRGPTLGPLSLVTTNPETTYKRAIMASKRLRVETSDSDLERQWEFERKARSVMLPRVVPATTPSQGQERQASRQQERHPILDLSSTQRQSSRMASKARSEPALGAAPGAMTPGARSTGPGPGGSPISTSSARGFWLSRAGPAHALAPLPSVGPDSPSTSAMLVTTPTKTGTTSLPAEGNEEDEELEESPAEQLWAAQLRKERLARSRLRFDALPRPESPAAPELPSPAMKAGFSVEDDVAPDSPYEGPSPARRAITLRFSDVSPGCAAKAPTVRLFEPELERHPSCPVDALPPEAPAAPGTPASAPEAPTPRGAADAPGPTPPTPASPLRPAAAPDGGRNIWGASIEIARHSFDEALSCGAPGVAAVPDLDVRLLRAKAAYLDSKNVNEVDGESLRTAFKRFQMPHGVEIAKDGLHDVMQSLGLGILSADEARKAADVVTPYNELDFDEFLRFVDSYFMEERDQLHAYFLQYDPERTGGISVDSLRELMPVIGITPMHSMMLEALAMIGIDTKGSVDFEAFVCFMVVYRHTEGFARSEVERLHKAFVRFVQEEESESGLGDIDTSDLQLPISQVGMVLVQVFGLQVQEEANKLQKQAASLSRSRGVANASDPAEEQELTFREFLTFARWLREAELQRVRKEFTRHTDNAGSIRVEELPCMLKAIGYEPLQPVIEEIAAEVETLDLGRLNVEEFFQFLLIFQSRDGFLSAELEEMQQVFLRFDEDGSETIDVPELGTMLRHMGYYLGLDDIHLLVKEVDVNHRGSLDYQEFRRLMRLHRDREVRRYRAIFERYTPGQKPKNARIGVEDIHAALEDALGHLKTEAGDEAETDAAKPEVPQQPLDFEAFYDLAESNRSAVVATLRRFAGFSREMVEMFKELFKKWDADDSGVIDPNEIEGLLKELGMECRTVEEQRSLIAQLDAARAKAIEAGVEPECRPGEGAICFWVLVQLMRLLKNEREQSAEAHEAEVVKELDFSKAEVEDFREVFLRWTRHGGNAGEEGQDDCHGAGGGFGARAPSDEEGLSRATFSKLLLSLGVTLTKKEKEELDDKFSRADMNDHGHLSFLGFLGLMRWLLDSDFAGVNDAAQQTISAAVQKRRQSLASMAEKSMPKPQ